MFLTESRTGSLAPIALAATSTEVAVGRPLRRRVLWPAYLISSILLVSGIAGAASLRMPFFSTLPTTVLICLSAIALPLLLRLRLPGFVVAPIMLFFVIVALAAVVSLSTTTVEFAIRGTAGLLGFVCAALATAVASGSSASDMSVARRRTILLAITTISFITALWALRQSLIGFSTSELVAISTQESTSLVGTQIRSSGMFAVNQEFGLFSACVTPALLVLALRANRYRSVYMVAFITLLAALLLSLTRTAIVAAVVVSLIALVLNAPGRNVVIKGLLGLLIFAVVFGIVSLVAQNSTDARVRDATARIATLTNVEEDGSFNDRTSFVWKRGIDLMTAHPFGLGAGAAGPVSSRFPNTAPAGNVTTDQGYLMVGVQVGWGGLIVFVWMLVAILVWLIRSDDTAARAGAMALLALMIAMTASQYWSLSAPITLVGALVGVGIGGATSTARRQGVRDRPLMIGAGEGL